LLLSAQLFSSFPGQAHVSFVVREALGAAVVAEAAHGVVVPAALGAAVVAEAAHGVVVPAALGAAAAVVAEPAHAAGAVVAADGVLDQPVLVDAGAVFAEPALAPLAAVDVGFAELLVDGALGRIPSAVGGVLDRPVLVDADVARLDRVVSSTVQPAVFRVSAAQAASDVQAVGVQQVFGGLPVARVTLQVAFFVPVVDGAIPPAFFGGLPDLFPALSVSAYLVRWIAGFRGSAVDRVNSTR